MLRWHSSSVVHVVVSRADALLGLLLRRRTDRPLFGVDSEGYPQRRFMKSTYLVPLPAKLSELVAIELVDYYRLFGPPAILQSDN